MADDTVTTTVTSVIDDQDAQVVLVNGVRGMMEYDGIVSINMTNPGLAATGSETDRPFDKVVARLTMSAPAFARITDFFVIQRDRMIKEGKIQIAPNSEADSGKT